MLGATVEDEGKPPQVYLFVDRLGYAREFQHVVMHELLHAAGLDDLPGADSVMSFATCESLPQGTTRCPLPMCMTAADQAEFCRVHRCQIDELNGCR